MSTTNLENNNSIEENTSSVSLKRALGLFDGVNILVGIMVGSGIFYLGSYVLMRSGMSLGLALLVWIIGGIVTLISGLCYAELGAMLPKAGGRYVYLKEAYGNTVAFTAGLSSFVLGSCGSTAGLAIAFAAAVSVLLPMSAIMVKLFAIVMVIILTIINIIGVKQGSIIQNIFTVGKLIPIGLILVAGLFMGDQTPDLSLTSLTSTVSIPTILGMIGFAVVATLWAYEGWTNLNTISEEIKNPKRNIPLSIIVAIVLVTVLYTAFNYAIYRVVPMETINTLINSGSYYLGTEASTILFGNVGGTIVTVCMIVSIFGALNGCVLVFPRACFAMSRDNMLPKALGNVHPKYQTPHVSLIVHLIITIALIFTRDLNQVTSLVVFSGMIFNTMTFCSVLTLRKKMPNLERPYRVPTIIVYLSIIIMIALTLNTFVEDPITSIIGVFVTLIATVIYFVFYKKRGE